MIFRRSPSADRDSSAAFDAIRKRMDEDGAEARVWRKIHSRMAEPQALRETRNALMPDPAIVQRIWRTIVQAIRAPAWGDFRDTVVSGSLSQNVWSRIQDRLEPVYARAFSRPVKWMAAVAVLLLVVRISPLLFLAPPSIAESPVMLLATQGQVEILAGSGWQPVDGETALRHPTTIRTQDGEATVMLHDDAVIRLGPSTSVALLDLSDRPDPSPHDLTLSVLRGDVWVFGLVPAYVRGITVLTSQGRVAIHEGSVSIHEGDAVRVAAWDRSAILLRRGQQYTVLVGRETTLTRDSAPNIVAVDPARFQDAWTAQNLRRDAVHRKEIAQLQQQRLASQAGILPNSVLYPVKRLAEKVDVLFSFNEEDRAKKLITQANTRLNEAAALLQDGDGEVQATIALQEYKDTLLDVASGSGGNAAVRSLIAKEVMEDGTATIAAALPGDAAYAIKQAVGETIQAMPDALGKPDVQGEAIVDQLAVVKQQADEGETTIAREKLTMITDSMASLASASSLAPGIADVRQDALEIAEHVAAVVEGPTEAVLQLGIPEKEIIQPQHPVRNVLSRPLTPAQVSVKAQEIRGRIFVFGERRSRYNALLDQLSLLEGNPDRGSILRELVRILPEDGLAQRVAREIRSLQLEVAEEAEVTASGGGVPVQ